MSTRAGIGIKQPDGSVKAIYLHFDGYPGHAGAMLGGWYKTSEQVEALLALGNLRGIDETLEKTEAYHQDCGKELSPANSYASVEEYQMKGKSDFGADYLYLFDEGCWPVYGLHNDPDLRIKLTGEDGNAFVILGRVRALLRRNGYPQAFINQFAAEVKLNCFISRPTVLI